ncbi:MAG: hypothetical protein V1904_00220 [Bacteroidota bacterium]
MNRYFFFMLFLAGMAMDAKPQITDEKFNIKFSGFVKAEAMFDTRQTVNAREQMLLFYPDMKKLDVNGNDVNAHPNLNQLAMASRITLTATGPDAFGAKVRGVMEGDFTGPSNVENNAFRLRHAYIKLNWSKAELIMGQYWHPLNVPEMIPFVISLNTGAPFHPFSRQPQIRFSKSFGSLNAVIVASSNRDYSSMGPLGTTNDYLRNSAIPSMHMQLQYKKNDNLLFGIGGDYKKLTPRLITDSLWEADETLDCIAATAFMKVKTKKLTIKLQSVFGQNLYEHLMIGGFAVEKIDTISQRMTYTSLDQFSVWSDISTNFEKKFNAGLFLGYVKNLGSLHNVWGAPYGRGTSIAHVYRISPRLMWSFNNLSFASEFEYTVAAYGTPDYLYDVLNASELSNFRVELALQYNF